MIFRDAMRRSGRAATLMLVTMLAAGPVAAQASGGATKQPPTKPPVKPPARIPVAPKDIPKEMPKPQSPKVPETFEGLFAERDRRAVGALGYMRCMERVFSAGRSGQLGRVPTAWGITCIEQGKEWRGVFGEFSPEGELDVRLQYALRGTTGVVTKDPVDTGKVSGTARALLRGLAAPLPGGGKFEVIPVPLALDKYIEVWFLPTPGDPSRILVGGDSLIQMSGDGGREFGHGRNSAPFRTLTVPPNATSWTLQSVEERIPAVSELIAAHRVLERIPEVKVVTNQYESVLTRGARDWVHRRK